MAESVNKLQLNKQKVMKQQIMVNLPQMKFKGDTFYKPIILDIRKFQGAGAWRRMIYYIYIYKYIKIILANLKLVY